MIQKRRSLHSGHVWCMLTLYGAITYAPPMGGCQFYASVRGYGSTRKKIGKRGTANRPNGVRHGRNSCHNFGGIIVQFKKRWTMLDGF